MKTRCIAACAVALTVGLHAAGEAGADRVAGNLIQFNDNGAWSWFQDERVIVDGATSLLLVGSVAAPEGPGGTARGGNVEVVAFDPATGRRALSVLHERLEADDHDLPALLVRPDGRYLAMYARHNTDRLSRWRISRSPHDPGRWSDEEVFDWTPVIGADRVTYSNLHYLSAENRLYNFARAVNRDPSILISSDHGSTWTYGGKLLTQQRRGYVNGYLKYASNGTDRIHFITTEHHPRDFNNSIYHGYVEGGKLHRSDGTVVDENVLDADGRPQTELTRVFAAGSVFAGETMTRAWTTDLQLDGDGNPYGLITARANDIPDDSNFNDHRFFYIRFDGRRWNVHPLAKAGPRLWEAEQDYTGLGALHPHDPNRLYISTPIDPGDGRQLARHEIFEGVTADGGRTWVWTAVTQNSTVDNLRPVIPAWDPDHTAVLWFRGSMRRSQQYDAAIVGIIEDRTERPAPVRYVDADAANTTSVDGRLWQERAGVGNGGSVLSSGESTAEDRPALQTTLGGLPAGRHDIFVFFWGDPKADWRIRAGLRPDELMLFRRQACQQAESRQFDRPGIVLRTAEGASLYRAYVGRVQLREGEAVTVHIDDQVLGSDGNTRTWFDGVGYSAVASR